MKSIKMFFASVFAVIMSVFTVPVFAAVPTVVGTTITSVQTDISDLADLVWPFVLAVLGIVILMKMAKRLINKA